MESGAGTSGSPVAGTGRPDEDGDEFGLFDDSVAGDARDPYPELAQARREHPVQKLDTSMMPHDEALPVFFVYRFEDIARVLAGLRHLLVGSHHRHDHGPGNG